MLAAEGGEKVTTQTAGMTGGMGQFVKAGSVVIDLLEESGLRRHLHEVGARCIERLVAADAEVHARCGDHFLGKRHNLPLGQRCRRSEEHTSELQSLMRISYAVFCLKKKNKKQ